jgi:hypothetical protein
MRMNVFCVVRAEISGTSWELQLVELSTEAGDSSETQITEEERWPLEAATEQRLGKTQKTLFVL